jgi:hypothetical protein
MDFRLVQFWAAIMFGLWEVEGSTFYGQSAHRWRWGCQPYAPAALCPQEDSWYSISVRGWVDPRTIVRLEPLGQLKNPMTSGIESATYRLVRQCLNQLCYRMPPVVAVRRLTIRTDFCSYDVHVGCVGLGQFCLVELFNLHLQQATF